MFSCEFCQTFNNTFFTEHNTTLVYYISFIEGIYQGFILVLCFGSPNICIVALFIFDFLGVSSDFYF